MPKRKHTTKPKPNKPVEPVTQDPPLETQEPQYEYRGGNVLWPQGRSLPQRYLKLARHAAVLPCPRCRHMWFRRGGCRAVRVRHANDTIAYLECRACGHAYKLPVTLLGADGAPGADADVT